MWFYPDSTCTRERGVVRMSTHAITRGVRTLTPEARQMLPGFVVDREIRCRGRLPKHHLVSFNQHLLLPIPVEELFGSLPTQRSKFLPQWPRIEQQYSLLCEVGGIIGTRV